MRDFAGFEGFAAKILTIAHAGSSRKQFELHLHVGEVDDYERVVVNLGRGVAENASVYLRVHPSVANWRSSLSCVLLARMSSCCERATSLIFSG